MRNPVSKLIPATATQVPRRPGCLHGTLRKRGFTLPELMVVVTVVGLLSGQALPSISQGLDSLMLGRVGNSLLAVTESVRQQAITQEQDAVIEFFEHHWCARFTDAEPGSCGLASGKLPNNYRFEAISGNIPSFLFSAGRGFSQFNSGTLRVVKRSQQGNPRAIYLVNSSLGRVRICANKAFFGIPLC